MKLSTEQKNYLTAIALRDAVTDVYIENQTPENEKKVDDAYDLVELRTVELFRWGRSRAETLHRQLVKMGVTAEAITPALEMLDQAIAGEFIRNRDQLANLMMKLEA